MLKRAAIYDPYLDTLGGGERYCLTVAEILLKNGYNVDLFWSGEKDLINRAEKRFSLNLGELNIVPDIFQTLPNKVDLFEEKEVLNKIASHQIAQPNILNKILGFIEKIKITKNYDLLFYLTDGSLPFLFSHQNFIHVQVPFLKKNNFLKKITNLIKLQFISKIICNSFFTQKFTQKTFNSNTKVIYPPVDIEKFNPNFKKENIILSVGRFDNVLNAKKQDILIDAFKIIFEKNKTKNWKLILAGGSLEKPEKNLYLRHLQTKSQNLPIEFIVNPDFETLQKVYSSSKIYWHAAGFDVNEEKEPQNTEHFGITVVEAMASGLVPVVVNKGGLPEIVKNDINGYLWNSIEELVSKTQILIASSQLLQEISQESIKNSKKFSKENFEKQFLSLI